MLSVIGIDINGNKLENMVPVSVKLDIEENVPADCIRLVFAMNIATELTGIEVLKDSKVIFTGAVDEQVYTENEAPFTEIVARSYASRLIDNEAYPMSMNSPSAEDIAAYYIKPCGINCVAGENRMYPGRFTVAKGSSCFSVVKRFCGEVYSAFPRVNGNSLYMSGVNNAKRLWISNKDGISYKSIKVTKLRCNRISEVRAKLKEGEGYTAIIKNPSAEADKISAVRYLNASKGSSTPLPVADSMIKSSENSSFNIVVVCNGCFATVLGATADVQSNTVLYKDLYVSEVSYSLSNKGEFTKLTLKRKE